MSRNNDPHVYDELEIIVRVVMGKDEPRKKRIVVEILTDGTTAVGREISERTKEKGAGK